MKNPLLHFLSLLSTQPLLTQSRSFLLAILCPVPLLSFAWHLFTL
ncbi:MAG: hypothetical protein ACPG5L_12575 [Vibrio gallaecicus]|uniref:Uncharacterized protein n=1 Tax=Vibrio gallaecicus TaxID=552386 RepID=A0ABV4N9G4_9VIBR|nr:hypothetical protein [Vibrio gallaecicus]MDN3617726.1 hypothetical protein [Vibrio gallaecicus]